MIIFPVICCFYVYYFFCSHTEIQEQWLSKNLISILWYWGWKLFLRWWYSAVTGNAYTKFSSIWREKNNWFFNCLILIKNKDVNKMFKTFNAGCPAKNVPITVNLSLKRTYWKTLPTLSNQKSILNWIKICFLLRWRGHCIIKKYPSNSN